MANRRMKYAEIRVVTDGGECVLLGYDLLIDEAEIGGSLIEAYGVGVSARSDARDQRREIRALAVRRYEIERILDVISRGTVFPEDLPDVLENLMESSFII